jgi:hypothetical protein
MYRNETKVTFQRNYDTLSNDDYTTLNQWYENEQRYHPIER